MPKVTLSRLCLILNTVCLKDLMSRKSRRRYKKLDYKRQAKCLGNALLHVGYYTAKIIRRFDSQGRVPPVISERISLARHMHQQMRVCHNLGRRCQCVKCCPCSGYNIYRGKYDSRPRLFSALLRQVRNFKGDETYFLLTGNLTPTQLQWTTYINAQCVLWH